MFKKKNDKCNVKKPIFFVCVLFKQKQNPGNALKIKSHRENFPFKKLLFLETNLKI